MTSTFSDKINKDIKEIDDYFETKNKILYTFIRVGNHYRELKNIDKAIEYYEYVIENTKDGIEITDDVLLWLMIYYTDNIDKCSFTIIQKIVPICINRKLDGYYYYSAVLLMKNNKSEQAFRILEKGIAKNCFKSIIYFLKSHNDLKSFKYREIIEKAKSLYSDRVECLEVVGMYYAKIEESDLGLKYCIEAEKKGSKKVYYHLAYLYYIKDGYISNRAEKYFVLSINENNIQALEYYGYILIIGDRIEEGLKYLKIAITKGSINYLKFYLNKGGKIDGETFLMLMKNTKNSDIVREILLHHVELHSVVITYFDLVVKDCIKIE